MLRPIEDLSVDVVPQAIVNLTIAEVIGKSSKIVSGEDDLDAFEGASYKLDDELEISVRRYRGYPENTATIYIDRNIDDIDQISKLVRQILKELDVPLSALQWERRDDPEL